MVLELTYEKKEDVPEAYLELYTETEGKYNLTGINGMVTKVDVDKLNTALGKERTDHKETKKKVAVWGDMDQEKVVADLQELIELRAAAEAGDPDGKNKEAFEAKVNKVAEARIDAAKIASDRRITELETEGAEKDVVITSNAKRETGRTIGEAVDKACRASKVIDTAIEDVKMLGQSIFEINEEGLVLTGERPGITPGIAPEIWLSGMQENRPHWWPMSTGGGSKGGGGAGGGFPNNPFSGEHWNMTTQARAIGEDRAKAERMALAAGTKIGAPRPVVKKV